MIGLFSLYAYMRRQNVDTLSIHKSDSFAVYHIKLLSLNVNTKPKACFIHYIIS